MASEHSSIADEFEDMEKRLQDLRVVWNYFPHLHGDGMLRAKLLSRTEIMKQVLNAMEAEVGKRLDNPTNLRLPF